MTPNSPKTPARQIRIAEEWYEFEKAAEAAGTERSVLVREFIAWYLHKPGAKMPKRPEREAWEERDD